MTSIHPNPSPAIKATASSSSHPDLNQSPSISNSPASSFSDAYKEDAQMANVKNGDSTLIDDDYAMTFDSDGEELSDRQDTRDILQENFEPGIVSLPSIVSATNPSSTYPSQKTDAIELPHPGASAVHPPHLNPTTHVDQAPEAPDFTVNHNSTNSAQIPIVTTSTFTNNEMPSARPQAFDDLTASGIDIQQLLDNITANAEKPDSPYLKNHSLPMHASLPPRPIVSQSRNRPDEAPKYFVGTPGLPPASSSYRPPGGISSLVAAGAPGTSTDPRSGLPPPPSASFRGPLSATTSTSPTTYISVNQSSVTDLANYVDNDDGDDFETKWAPKIQKMYDEFLEDERRYVTEGMWDRFPVGSRLFIGNLPSEKVTKRDLFHIFHHYGKIAQISIKQAYGFVQFLHSDHCYKALDSEQGAEVRGRKMHLEISKPQKNTRNAQHAAASTGQRNKSPDRSANGRSNRNNDRFDRLTVAARPDEQSRSLRIRDDYRPARPASPPRSSNFRGRDAYIPNLRETHDARDRRRSRSPYNHRDNGKYRERSLSPRARDEADDIEMLIPRRDPRDVPDMQIILLEQLDRQFVSWVESEVRGRGVKVEVMFLSPRVPIEMVIRRQILEGVYAVSRLDVSSQNCSKIPLQVFDRQGGANDVRFDEYQDLDPKIAGELVLRAKQSQPLGHSQAPPFAQTPFVSPTYQNPAMPATANLASLVGSLDNATLQKLLETLNTPQQQQNAPQANAPSVDLVSLLGGFKQNPAIQNYAPPITSIEQYSNAAHPGQNPYISNNSATAYNQSQPHQPAQQVQNIMAQLARFRQ
ncbi:BgTH12-02701 [Blumeria graminis f. sp. triticale]|uniref:Bgt-3949 n=2 Tax=Blumeria graminis TaxID=34373 RepID=A0A9X9MI33_BLUGR|nr:BgTH12-02701 [Blumeria graminis f. sp. triticale]VDB88966.1 Bgt-3949 [Blumeria graminis f. sp. tritici]